MTPADDDLTPGEREALQGLPHEPAPPPGLEAATVRALAERGLLRRSIVGRRGIRPALAVAASLLLFAAGLALGRLGGPSSTPADHRPRFALFLYEGPTYDQPAPGAMGERVREYIAWASEPRENAVVEGGEKLREDGGAVVAPEGLAGEAALPRSEPRLAGYFLVRAADRRAALEIARTCPHVRYGGAIVVREIEPT